MSCASPLQPSTSPFRDDLLVISFVEFQHLLEAEAIMRNVTGVGRAASSATWKLSHESPKLLLPDDRHALVELLGVAMTPAQRAHCSSKRARISPNEDFVGRVRAEVHLVCRHHAW
jgi:hypothetical protein